MNKMRNRRTVRWGVKEGFTEVETLDRVVGRGAHGDRGKGEHEESGGGGVTEGRRPSWGEEGMTAKPVKEI